MDRLPMNSVVTDPEAACRFSGFHRRGNDTAIGGFNVYVSHGAYYVTRPDLTAYTHGFPSLVSAMRFGRENVGD